jgi:hypothetical protein
MTRIIYKVMDVRLSIQTVTAGYVANSMNKPFFALTAKNSDTVLIATFKVDSQPQNLVP